MRLDIIIDDVDESTYIVDWGRSCFMADLTVVSLFEETFDLREMLFQLLYMATAHFQAKDDMESLVQTVLAANTPDVLNIVQKSKMMTLQPQWS